MGSVLQFIGGFLLVASFMGGWMGIIVRHFANKVGPKDIWTWVMVAVQVFALFVLALVSIFWRASGLVDFVNGALFGIPTIVLWLFGWRWHYKQRKLVGGSHSR